MYVYFILYAWICNTTKQTQWFWKKSNEGQAINDEKL